MRKLRLVIVAVALALAPLGWVGTIAPPAQPIHTHDRSGKAITLAGSTLSVPVAEAHSGTTVARTDDRRRHIQHLVKLQVSGGYVHAECWAKNDGGSHDHSHRITACQLRTNYGVTRSGTCATAGGYGPCGYSMQDQHWHSPAEPVYIPYCYYVAGGFDTVGHSHATVYAPAAGSWCAP